jgi:predicted metal-dependent hydrolase
MHTTIYNMLIGSMKVSVEIKDIKNVHLSVYPPYGDVRVSAPLGTALDTLRVYISSRISWIRKQQSKIRSQKRVSPREFLTQESHFIRGQRYLMEVLEGQPSSKVELLHNSIRLSIKSNIKMSRSKIFEKWQRAELSKDITKLIEKWEPMLEVKASGFAIRKMKTKWGSCNPISKTINLNLILLEKPPEHLQYVVVHELIHLLERKHNANFVAHMDKFLPNWKQLKVDLNALVLEEMMEG